MIRSSLLFLLCLLSTAGMAQKAPTRFYVKLSGVVTDHFSGDPIKGAMVRLLKAGKTEAEVVTRGDGRYSFDLDKGWRYAVWYSNEGCVTKHVNIDTEEVPPYPDVPFYEMDVPMTLVESIHGFDFTVFEDPLGGASYKHSVRNVSWDMDYTERMRPRLSKTMDEYEKAYKGYYKRRQGRRPPTTKFDRPKEAVPADSTVVAPRATDEP